MRSMLILERDFLLSNLYWIVLLALVALIALVYLVEFLLARHRMGKKEGEKAVLKGKEDYLVSLGGADNVLTHKLTGSRIVLTLVDQGKIDREALTKTGITGFIEKSDQLTLVAGNAKEIYSLLFPEDVGE